MSISTTLQGTIQHTDSTSNATVFTKQLLQLLMVGSSFLETNQASIDAAPTSITLPVPTIQFLYIKNLHATQTLQVTWAPTGGAANIVITLEPDSVIIFLEANPGGGITSLSLEGSAPNTTCEYVLAG